MNYKSKIVNNLVRTFSTSSVLLRSHYDELGLTPRANQNDIKTAYYKLSKIYHPDKSNDEESAKKFRAITEAYEVLGNVKLKKMYDRGLLSGSALGTQVNYEPEPEPADPSLKFHKSRAYRNIIPTMDGRRPIYDFETWAKNHYGKVFRESQYDKELLKKKEFKRFNDMQSDKQEINVYFILFIGGLFTFVVINGTSNYDQDTTSQHKKQMKVSKSD